jgi:dTDP-4-amino-4,6-dideoxygalactose transaminase
VQVAEEAGVLLIEDAAQAFLSTYKGHYLGTIGNLGCISFHYTKKT